MNTIPNMNDYNLTPENLFRYEISKPYWREFSSKEFVQSIVHNIRQELFVLKTRLDFICNDQNVNSTPLEALNNLKTVRENCEDMSLNINRLKEILDLAWAHANDLD